MSNFLYYDTLSQQLQMHHDSIQFPFKKDIVTQLPKSIAVIRVVATLAFSSLIAFRSAATAFCLPIVVAGIGFAGWTIYSHLFSKDCLMEVFYKISGGKDKFQQLPEIQLQKSQNEKISEAIGKLKWDNLEHPIAKAKTLDGRNIIVIKDFVESADSQTKSILVFVEKLGPYDIPRTISNLHEFAQSVIHAIFSPFQGNTFSRFLKSSSFSSGNQSSHTYCGVYCAISKDMANKLFAQVAPH